MDNGYTEKFHKSFDNFLSAHLRFVILSVGLNRRALSSRWNVSGKNYVTWGEQKVCPYKLAVFDSLSFWLLRIYKHQLYHYDRDTTSTLPGIYRPFIYVILRHYNGYNLDLCLSVYIYIHTQEYRYLSRFIH